MSTPKKRNILLILAFNVLIIVVLLMLGEFGFLLFADRMMKTPDQIRESSLEYAPSIFSCHAFPQKEVLAQVSPKRRYYINRLGYRGEPFEIQKPDGNIRIMFYGGSQVFDSPADLAHDWPHVIGYILKDKGVKNIEIINAGTPGHASFDSLGRFMSEGHLFHPDYVVLCHAWNDIKYFSKSTPILRQFKPYDQTKDPRLFYRNQVDRLLGDHSQIYLHLRNAYFKNKLKLGAEGREGENDLNGVIQPEALAQFRITVATFVDLVRNAGAVPILMTQPRLAAPTNQARQWRRIAYAYTHFNQKNLLEAFRQTDKILREVAEEKQVELIDASQSLTGEDRFFIDHVHFHSLGSRAMAEVTAGRLKDIIEKPESPPATDHIGQP